MFLRAEVCVPGNNPIYPIVSNGFSLDMDNFVVMGGTVTYALLQIVFYMGFDTVLLVGVDHSYPKASKGKAGTQFMAEGEDPDHFETVSGIPYFTPGRKYNRPELDGTKEAYKIAKEVFKKTNKQIFNLTPRSKLDVFEKSAYKKWS